MGEPEAKMPMTYDDEIREALISGPEWDAETLTDAIPDGTLKIDGKFYRAVPYWRGDDCVPEPVNRGAERFAWEGPEHDDLMEADWRVDS